MYFIRNQACKNIEGYLHSIWEALVVLGLVYSTINEMEIETHETYLLEAIPSFLLTFHSIETIVFSGKMTFNQQNCKIMVSKKMGLL